MRQPQSPHALAVVVDDCSCSRYNGIEQTSRDWYLTLLTQA